MRARSVSWDLQCWKAGLYPGRLSLMDYPTSCCVYVMFAANVQGRLTADLVSALAYGRDKTKGERVLP
jgi:hypothetical protein